MKGQNQTQNNNYSLLSYLRPFTYNKKIWITALAALLVIIIGLAYVLAGPSGEDNGEGKGDSEPAPVSDDKNGDEDKKDSEKDDEKTASEDKVDDWQYEAGETPERNMSAGSPSGVKKMDSANVQTESSKMGLSAGGAKDVNNFRENIENDHLPLPTDIEYEGLFYDYYFDTGQKEECEEMFCPSYSYAVSPDPISDDEEVYLSVGLNSGLEESDFERKKLNLVVVLDVSGSMNSQFNDYYYDRFGNKVELEEEEREDKSKMQIASESLAGLIDHLEPEDRLGVVLYNDQGKIAKPLRKVEETRMDKIKDHILEISAGGGTQMSAGMEKATGMLQEYRDVDRTEYENRVIFLTDAMPNLGETSEEGLLGMTETNAEDGIHSTFVGMGVDFNSELVNTITKVKGANYYSVHSSEQFKERMDDQFEYMVTPLVFDLELRLDAQGYDIAKVYGSPEADESTGEIMKVNTLFPSDTEEGKTKGGIALLQLEKTSDQGELNLEVDYETRDGTKEGSEDNIEIDEDEGTYYDNSGIRKAVLLSRYADLMKNWMIDQRQEQVDKEPEPVPPQPLPEEKYYISEQEGIVVPPPFPELQLGEWERESVSLEVSDHYRDMIEEFEEYFRQEQQELGDDNLDQEMQILDKLQTVSADN